MNTTILVWLSTCLYINNDIRTSAVAILLNIPIVITDRHEKSSVYANRVDLSVL